MAAAIPLVLAYGAYKQGADQASALRANASVYSQESQIAATQGYEAEAQQRRRAAMVLGSETAAAGQAGAGFQGSTGRALKQSAVNTELDALNIRYKAQLQRWAYNTQAGNLRGEAGTAARSGYLKAGAALLSGYAGNYTGTTLG